jgi:thermostable 8-oxoguanine DNA glycosylase
VIQLNFLTGHEKSVAIDFSEPQREFWDESFNPIKVKREALYEKIEDFFTTLDYSLVDEYKTYWNDAVSPKNDSEVFQRWLFAFMSVHTSWKRNIIGYEAIKNWWEWLNNWEELLRRIDDSKVGMQNNRLKYISEFSHKFWKNPSVYRKDNNETWVSYRDRLKERTLGLGPAKTSFAIEMCYPIDAKICCLDTHMFQAYGLDQSKDLKKYGEIELHWITMCNLWQIPPYIARCLYWDRKQGYSNSRYWSYALEPETWKSVLQEELEIS